MFKDALISEDGVHRYWLTRVWHESQEKLGFLMLNPSTADADADDPTIRKCMGFARKHGFGGIEVVNLFSFRATNPKELFKQHFGFLEGPLNLRKVDTTSQNCAAMVFAWGANIKGDDLVSYSSFYAARVLRSNPKVFYIGDLTSGGQPRHPLMAAYNLPFNRWHSR